MIDTVAAAAARRPARGGRALLPGLALLLLLAMLLSAVVGPVPLSAGKILAILLDETFLPMAGTFTQMERSVLIDIRLPRTLMAVLVGATLGISGALMQGLFRNPLADPGLIGVSSGAALAAACWIALLGTNLALTAAIGGYGLPLAAFAGGLAVTGLVYRLAGWRGHVSIAAMLLAGIAVNALAFAGIGLLVFISDDSQLRDITFWSMGSLAGASWDQLAAMLPFMLLPLAMASSLADALNGLILGEREAGHLGFDIEALKRRVVLAVAAAVGAGVAFTGLIGFVGIVVPHLVRLIAGADHRRLLPGAALLGASLLLLADLLARVAVAPAELPVGLVTSLLGTPVFLSLLLRRQREGGLTL